MMDKELIAMCDCPEIQDRWEPKAGDRYWIALPNMKPLLHTAEHWDLVNTLKKTRDFRTYIPRIEDVLEWLVPIQYVDWMHAFKGVSECSLWMMPMPIKALLKAYMHLEHNKTWKDGKWISA